MIFYIFFISKKMCIIIGKKPKKQCKFESKPNYLNLDMCTRHFNIYIKEHPELKREIKSNDDEETKECSYKSHNLSSSPYEKDKVPISLFTRKAKYSKKLCSQCEHCRIYRKNLRALKLKEFSELKEKMTDENFSVCMNLRHHNASEIPRDRVPKIMFMKNPEDPNTKIYETCSVCRKADKDGKKEKEIREKNISIAKETDKFYCITCCIIKEKTERGINRDGTESAVCKNCKDHQYQLTKEHLVMLKEVKAKIIMEIISERGYSCEMCKSIFLKCEENRVTEISTYEENGIRMIKYLGNKYESRSFIQIFWDEIEIRIMDFDHLPENEQLERGIIQAGESPYTKKKYIGQHKSEFDMRNEIKGCQLIDCICHTKITINRENGNTVYTKNKKEKMNYVNSLKKKGCSNCGYYEEGFERAIDMDHIDPQEKDITIAALVSSDDYNLDDVIKECKKTRPLCKFCHRIHTQNQRDEGII